MWKVNMVVRVFLLLVLTSKCVFTQDQPFLLGGIFFQDTQEYLKEALELSAEMYNFTTSIVEVSKKGEILEISDRICSMAKEGVIGIIDGTGGRSTEHVQSVCDMLELPYVVIQQNQYYSDSWSQLNLYPSPSVFNMVLEKLITLKDWNNFTVLYAKGHSLASVHDLLKMGNDTDRFTVSIRELGGDDYRDVLIDAKENGFVNFVVDVPSSKLEQLLLHAQQVGLMADEHSYIFLSPDLFTVDLSRYRYGGVNMTGFRLLDLKQNEELWDFTKKFNEKTGGLLQAYQLKTKVILIHDAVKVFANAIKKLGTVGLKPMELDCGNYESWVFGSSLLNFMRTNKIEGLSRALIFDGFGQRINVNFDILELTPAGNQTIGTWNKNELVMSRPLVPEVLEPSIMGNKTFKVLISQTPPYGYVKESATELEGNDRYEGFTVDLIARLGEILGFNYEFEIDNDYGSIDHVTKKWRGMVLKLREEKADFAICDFTITAERQSGIDFSTPFMTVGIGILYKEPSKQPPEMFSFMAVFAKEVWYYMMLAELGLAVIMIFVGRISHKEWQNPVPCIEKPEVLNNQFSFANSVWLIIGSVMQQGSEIAPIALAPRMITSFWWFFTMVMVASYTGTLVAFLIVEKNVLPFNNVKELYEHKSISYGAKEKGSTLQFFKDSNNDMYQKMYQKMQKNNWLVKDNDIGVEIAENSTYALFMESSSIEYYKERHCDLLQIGGLLDSKSYGIGMKQNSPYKKHIDDALLKMKESGEIQKLKDLWWKEMRGGGRCGESRDEETKELGMKNMIGAFVVLGVGCLIGLLISTLDMLWGVFKRSIKYNTTFKYELVEELKFALTFSGDVKPVKRPDKNSGSSEALADAEAKDEVKSLRSIRSGHSTSTHRTQHSHSSRHSRHSSGGLSIAFAKRRSYN